jgi:hypothetical protein
VERRTALTSWYIILIGHLNLSSFSKSLSDLVVVLGHTSGVRMAPTPLAARSVAQHCPDNELAVDSSLEPSESFPLFQVSLQRRCGWLFEELCSAGTVRYLLGAICAAMAPPKHRQ